MSVCDRSAAGSRRANQQRIQRLHDAMAQSVSTRGALLMDETWLGALVAAFRLRQPERQ